MRKTKHKTLIVSKVKKTQRIRTKNIQAFVTAFVMRNCIVHPKHLIQLTKKERSKHTVLSRFILYTYTSVHKQLSVFGSIDAVESTGKVAVPVPWVAISTFRAHVFLPYRGRVRWFAEHDVVGPVVEVGGFGVHSRQAFVWAARRKGSNTVKFVTSTYERSTPISLQKSKSLVYLYKALMHYHCLFLFYFLWKKCSLLQSLLILIEPVYFGKKCLCLRTIFFHKI